MQAWMMSRRGYHRQWIRLLARWMLLWTTHHGKHDIKLVPPPHSDHGSVQLSSLEAAEVLYTKQFNDSMARILKGKQDLRRVNYGAS